MRAIFFVLLTASLPMTARADVFPSEPHVYVEGSSEIRVEPDTLELSLVVEATDPKLDAAKARVDERARKLVDACRQLGIADADIIAATLQIGPAYDYTGGRTKLIGTRVARPIDVKLRDFEKYSELIQAVVASGVERIDATTMSSSQQAKILQDAQQAALADARARAERFAAASGRKLGEAYSISEFDHRRQERYLLEPARSIGASEHHGSRYRGEVSALSAADEPFEPGTIVATATVYVIYLLEDD